MELTYRVPTYRIFYAARSFPSRKSSIQSAMRSKFTVEETVILRQWINHRYLHLDYSRLQQAIRKGDIRVNSKREEPQFLLQPGDVCEIWDKLLICSPKPIPAGLKGNVVAKNQDFWVFDKPYNLPTQGGTGITCCMLDIASSMMGRQAYCIHRLDRYTAGLLIVGCDSYAARDLGESLKAREWKKVYVAKIAPGTYPDSGKIVEDVYGKSAMTEFKVLERGSDYTLVRFIPVTGRMHQIRWHSATHLEPILGDLKFGSKVRTRMFLKCIELDVAFRGNKYRFQLPI